MSPTCDTGVHSRSRRHVFDDDRDALATLLAEAEAIEEDATADPEAATHLEEAIAAALAITAESARSDVRDARAHLRLAKAELEDEAPAPTA